MKCNQSRPGFELVSSCPIPNHYTTGTSNRNQKASIQQKLNFRFFLITLLKCDILWMRIREVIRSWKDNNFSEILCISQLIFFFWTPCIFHEKCYVLKYYWNLQISTHIVIYFANSSNLCKHSLIKKYHLKKNMYLICGMKFVCCLTEGPQRHNLDLLSNFLSCFY